VQSPVIRRVDTTPKGVVINGNVKPQPPVVLVPADPPPSFSLRIGDISGEEPYRCLLHDSVGMLGTLHIVPR